MQHFISLPFLAFIQVSNIFLNLKQFVETLPDQLILSLLFPLVCNLFFIFYRFIISFHVCYIPYPDNVIGILMNHILWFVIIIPHNQKIKMLNFVVVVEKILNYLKYWCLLVMLDSYLNYFYYLLNCFFYFLLLHVLSQFVY